RPRRRLCLEVAGRPPRRRGDMDDRVRDDISAIINLLHQPQWRLLTAANTCHDLVNLDYRSRARPDSSGSYRVLGEELSDWPDVRAIMGFGFGIHANKLDWLADIVGRVRGDLSA
ncbi:MAG: hypothetical protein ACRD3Q_01655, partial [Terriglobales bacterium]